MTDPSCIMCDYRKYKTIKLKLHSFPSNANLQLFSEPKPARLTWKKKKEEYPFQLLILLSAIYHYNIHPPFSISLGVLETRHALRAGRHDVNNRFHLFLSLSVLNRDTFSRKSSRART